MSFSFRTSSRSSRSVCAELVGALLLLLPVIRQPTYPHEVTLWAGTVQEGVEEAPFAPYRFVAILAGPPIVLDQLSEARFSLVALVAVLLSL